LESRESSRRDNVDSSRGNSVLRTIELRPLSYSREALLLALVEGSRHIGLIKLTRTKSKVKATLKYIGEERAHIYECKLREDEVVNPACFSKLARDIEEKLPGTSDVLVDALAKAIKEWEGLLEYAELKEFEDVLESNLQPVLEIETERGVVRVLASNGAVLDVHGGFIDLGDCVIVAESSSTYLQLVGVEGEYEKPSIAGLAVAYCRSSDKLEFKEAKWYVPFQTRLNIAGRLLRFKTPERFSTAYYTFADIEVLKAVAEKRRLSVNWSEVGEEIIEKLREYVVFSDERLYDVISSYIVMTYIHDVFTAVPFLWYHGPPGSGKTRANITTTYMCRHGIFIADPSEATLYRLVEATGATLGIDESALSERAKRIIAAAYKRGAVVPRAEPSRNGIVLKLFEATAPRVFSFKDLPSEDYLLQRIIPVNMLRSKPSREQDPLPQEFKEIREKLYYLRLTNIPEVLEVKKRSISELRERGVWGRDLEIWAPIYTAALLTSREKTVLDYILEDVARRRESELMYVEEKLVLYAIDELFSELPEPLVREAEKTIVFTASALLPKILNKLLEAENCIEVITTENSREEVKLKTSEPRCAKLLDDLGKKWKTQRIGLILRNLGFDKFKKASGKGRSARYVYIVPWSEFLWIARHYDYEPISEKLQGGEQ